MLFAKAGRRIAFHFLEIKMAIVGIASLLYGALDVKLSRSLLTNFDLSLFSPSRDVVSHTTDSRWSVRMNQSSRPPTKVYGQTVIIYTVSACAFMGVWFVGLPYHLVRTTEPCPEGFPSRVRQRRPADRRSLSLSP